MIGRASGKGTGVMVDMHSHGGHRAVQQDLPDDLFNRVPSLQRLAAEVIASAIVRDEMAIGCLGQASEVTSSSHTPLGRLC